MAHGSWAIRHVGWFPAVLAMATTFVGCALPRRPDAVGTFAGRAVTCAELRAFAAEERAIAPIVPVSETTATGRFEAFIVARMLEAEARRQGIERDPRFTHRLQAWKRTLLNEWHEAEWDPGFDAALDAPAAAAAVDTQPIETAVAGAGVRIVFRSADSGERTAVAALQAVQARFLSGDSFLDLAAEHSEHPSRLDGGSIDPAAEGPFGTAVAQVVARLEPGEVSDIVRLPGGFALVQRESTLISAPMVARPEPAPSLQSRAQRLAERRARQREDLIARARERFSVRMMPGALADTSPNFASVPIAYIDDEPVSLAVLGLADRPPLLREAVDDAIADELLVRMSFEEATAAQRAAFEALRRHLLAEMAMESLIVQRMAAEADSDARRRYDREPERFRRPERRLIEVVRVSTEDGSRDDAFQAARAIARIWKPDGPLHQRNRAELWGPVSEEEVAAYTSRDVSAAVFALPLGQVSGPILLPAQATAAKALGYAVMRVAEIEPAGPVAFEAVRDSLVQEVARSAPPAVRDAVRARILAQADPVTAPALLSCSLHPVPLEEVLPPPTPTVPGSVEHPSRPSVWGGPRLERRVGGPRGE